MEYEQFVDEFIDKLQQNIEQENVEIRRGTFTKINEKLDGISVKYPDSSVAPTVYLDEEVSDGSGRKLYDRTGCRKNCDAASGYSRGCS